jgi:hypothetical protein
MLLASFDFFMLQSRTMMRVLRGDATRKSSVYFERHHNIKQ